jgi:hypothetical protein
VLACHDDAEAGALAASRASRPRLEWGAKTGEAWALDAPERLVDHRAAALLRADDVRVRA